MTKAKYLKNEKPLETAVPLADVLEQYLGKNIAPRQKQWESIGQLWEDLVPATLGKHCRIKEVTSGTLKIAADSPVYMHELRLCADEVLREIQNESTAGHIKKIKVILERN